MYQYKGFTYTPTPRSAWDNLSMQEKSEMMKVAVRNGITDLPAIRQKYNEFAEGGKKKSSTNSLKQNFLTALDQSLREDNTFNTPQYRQFFTDLAKQESEYYPTITNSIGAKGYFQLMPGNRAASWSSPTQQFHEAYKLVKNNIDYFNKKLTKKDWDRAKELGIDMYGLLGGAHLGGVGGVVRALRGKGNAKDMNGSSVLGYMRQFSQSGKPTTHIQIPQASELINAPLNRRVSELTALPTPEYLTDSPLPYDAWEIPAWNPAPDFEGTELPETNLNTEDKPAYDEKAARQKRRNAFLNTLNLLDMVYGNNTQSNNTGFLRYLGNLIGYKDRLINEKMDPFVSPYKSIESQYPTLMGNTFTANHRGKLYGEGGDETSPDGNFRIKYVDSYRVNPETGGVYDDEGEIKEGSVILPEVAVTAKPMSYSMDDYFRRTRNMLTESVDNTAVINPRIIGRHLNPHLEERGIKGAKAHAAWEKEHPNLTAWGQIAGAVPFAVAAYPLLATIGSGAIALGDAAAATTVGQGITNFLASNIAPVATSTIAGAPALTWADAGLTSAFGAHGIQQAVEDGGISPMTALEIAPLYRPLTVLGRIGISKATPAVESFAESHPALYQYPRYAIGKFKYGFDAELPTLYRKFRNLPNVENGRITISNPNNRFAFDNGFGEESPIITNMTTDTPVRSHGLGDWDRDLTLAFPGRTLLGKKVISTRPSDTFTYGNNISVPVKDVVGFTGRPKEITFLQNSGIRSISSPEAEVFWESGAEDLSKQIRMWRTEHARRIGHKGINLGKNNEPSGDFRNYAATIENLTRETFKSPTMKDYEFMDYVFRPKYGSQTIPKVENFTIKSFDDYPLLGEWVGNTERRKYLEQPWRWSNLMYDPLTPVEDKFRNNLNIGLKPEFKK